MILKASTVFEKNWQALQEGYKILENVGSSRSTKTWSFFQIIFLYSLQNKRKRTVVMRDTAVACRELVESEFKDWMQDPLLRIKQFEKGLITGDELDKYLEEENLMQHVIENKTKHSYTFLNTGSTISFNGADNISKIIGKGNDLVWINEPYEFPEEVMLQLLKRLRVALLLDWNPSKDHYIEKFRSRPDCIHIHSTFMDNPFLDDSVRNELLGSKPLDNEYFDFEVEHYINWKREDIEKDLKNQPAKVVEDVLRCYDNEHFKTANKYHWEVYGLGRKAEKPNRIFHFKEITDKEWIELDVPVYYGVDWGAVDPMGVVAVKYYDGGLYCKELSYLSENSLKEKLTNTEKNQIQDSDEGFITWYFGNKLTIDPERPIICDNNRPSKIRALRAIGYDYAIEARKPKGSVIDGVDTLNNLDVYYTSTSVNLKYEQENYQRRVDRLGKVLEEPEDKDNHCFVGSTLVSTSTGLKPIKDVDTGDYVYTSTGLNKVLHKFNNGVKKTIELKIYTNEGVVKLQCTPNHKIKTVKGFKEVSDLKEIDSVFLFNYSKPISIQKLSIVQKDAEEVFDLMVDNEHEYFANGVLVHNCIDPMRYVVLFLQDEGIITKF